MLNSVSCARTVCVSTLVLWTEQGTNDDGRVSCMESDGVKLTYRYFTLKL